MRCSVSSKAGLASLRRGLCAVAVMVSAAVSWQAQGAALDKFSLQTPFPKDFLFGTALSGFQVDMGCPTVATSECEDRNSDWYAFMTSPWTLNDPLLHLTKEAPGAGPGFYELYRDDLKRAKSELGSNAVRISIEWSRIFPNATFDVNGYEALKERASPHSIHCSRRSRVEFRQRRPRRQCLRCLLLW